MFTNWSLIIIFVKSETNKIFSLTFRQFDNAHVQAFAPYRQREKIMQILIEPEINEVAIFVQSGVVLWRGPNIGRCEKSNLSEFLVQDRILCLVETFCVSSKNFASDRKLSVNKKMCRIDNSVSNQNKIVPI